LDRRTKQELLARLERDAQRICTRFGLRYRVLEAERANVKRRYGVCFSDGTIRIRLRHATSGRPLKYSSLVNTLCHELAHLRHFNHGPRFQAFYAQILEWARRERIYRPGPIRAAPVPVPVPSVSTSAPPPQARRSTTGGEAGASNARRPTPVSAQLELFG
jgi:hypothetical protein